MKEKLTTDHLTPRAICLLLGTNCNDPQNINRITNREHAQKDKITPWEIFVVEGGGGKPLWSHVNEVLIYELHGNYKRFRGKITKNIGVGTQNPDVFLSA